MLQTSSSTRVPTFDPQGHRMGPLGTLACQISVVTALAWSFGALGMLFLPTSAGLATLLPVLGALIVAPKSVIMQLPLSFSVLGMITISLASVMWTVDINPTSISVRAWIPTVIALTLAAGLLPMRDMATALVWTVRIVVALTVVALILMPATRSHAAGLQGVDGYAGWHGLFLHKNRMAPFLVAGISTLLTFDRWPAAKWGTLGVIGVLLVGSTSATGISAAFLVVVAWYWLRTYQNSQREDLRNSTLFFSASVLGFIGVVAGSIASLATITSAYGKELTFSGRTYIWAASIDAVERRPFLGHGIGALFWRQDVSAETARIWRQVGFTASHAHNGPLDLVLQIGLVGLAIYAVLWVTLFRGSWRMLSTRPDLSVWIISILFAQLFMSLSEAVYLGGWLALLCLMKVLVMRRPESLYAGPVKEMTRWA
jgi:O-antigen ligase